MTEEQQTVSVNELDNEGLDSWLKVSDSTNDITAEIIDVFIKGETAIIHYHTSMFPSKVFTDHLEASVNPDTKSEFERYINQLSGTNKRDTLIGKSVPVTIDRQEDNLHLSLKRPITTDNQKDQKTESIMGYFIIGVVSILFPFNLFVLYSILSHLSPDSDSHSTEVQPNSVSPYAGATIKILVTGIIVDILIFSTFIL